MMNYIDNRPVVVTDREKYLPFLYPLFMPALVLVASQIPVNSFLDALKNCLSLACLHSLLILLFQKILYANTYKQGVKLLIAAVLGSIIVISYLFLEYNFFNLAAHPKDPDKWLFPLRTMMNVPLLIALIGGIKSAADRKRLLIDNKKLENENAQAQLNVLIQRVSPHFLFNSLSVLQSMVRSKDARTETFVTTLADVYRQTLKKDKGMVTLQEELDFFNDYLFLMGLRQENALFVEVNIAEASLNYRLPIFALQLLAENCIKHNIVSVSKPLTIRLYQNDLKSVTISNNMQTRTHKNESFGIGIDNLKKRYALEGFEQGVLIENDEKTYTTTIKLL